MKLIRNIALTSFLTVAAFSAVTFTSCSKDDSGCAVGYTGSNCKDEVRASYYHTYKGNGSDNGTPPQTYTGFQMTFASSAAGVTKMLMTLTDASGTGVVSGTVTLNSNTTFTVDPVSAGGYSYSGTGTVTASTASLNLVETGGGSTITYTFNNMIAQ